MSELLRQYNRWFNRSKTGRVVDVQTKQIDLLVALSLSLVGLHSPAPSVCFDWEGEISAPAFSPSIREAESINYYL
jgi:hypothetical protein